MDALCKFNETDPLYCLKCLQDGKHTHKDTDCVCVWNDPGIHPRNWQGMVYIQRRVLLKLHFLWKEVPRIWASDKLLRTWDDPCLFDLEPSAYAEGEETDLSWYEWLYAIQYSLQWHNDWSGSLFDNIQSSWCQIQAMWAIKDAGGHPTVQLSLKLIGRHPSRVLLSSHHSR